MASAYAGCACLLLLRLLHINNITAELERNNACEPCSWQYSLFIEVVVRIDLYCFLKAYKYRQIML